MVGRRNVARLLAGTFLLAGSIGGAHAEVRALNLINTHTQERATVVFKRDGVYDQNGLQELNRLLRDWRRNEVTRMDPALFDLIWEVYRQTGAHEPIHIVCGYRSPATNNMLRSRSRGVAKLSQHMLGKAMDFYLPDVNLSTLRETGMKMQVGGVGFYPTSGSPFVHMDTGSVRAWPRMTRDQLVRLFPDGKTAHLPADGSPLPGYQTALAESEARKAKGGGPVESTSSSSGGGLLAALFGGGSSSSSTPTRVASAAEEDEENGASAPPPPPARSRQQEVRQGPLPPGSNPRILARGGDTPPGVAPTEMPNVSPKAKPVQMAMAAEPPAPPAPPVPTTVAKGSLVAMPVAGAQAPTAALNGRGGPVAPALASAEGRSSRFAAPAGNELPPGWIQGPSGRPVGEAANPAPVPSAAPERVAFSSNLKPIAAPLPVAKPGSETSAPYTLASASGRQLQTIAVAMPRPRPSGSMRVAALGDEARADPNAAFAALTGDTDGETPMMGYAPSTPAMPMPQVAASEAPVVSSQLPPLSPAAQASIGARAETRVASLGSSFPVGAPAARAKSDRAAAPATVSRPIAKTDRAAGARVFDMATATTGEDFAQLKHPDQLSLDTLMVKPRLTVAMGFSRTFEAPVGASFSGPAVVALPIVRTE